MSFKSSTRLPFIFFLLVLSSCAINKDFYLNGPVEQKNTDNNEVFHTIYFLGGSDEITLKGSQLGQHLNAQIAESGGESTLLLLGNNSLRSAHLKGDSSRKSLERIELLKRRYDFFNNLQGNYYAVLGPHEWANGARSGMDDARILEEIVEDDLTQENVIRPASGCPGPEEIEIGENIVLLLIDTQWLFHSWEKPNTEDGCDAESNLDFYLNLDDAISRNYNKKIIVAGYHSLEGNGRHGGYFPVSSHFIPLPVIGSIRVGIRSILGSPDDLTNPGYQVFANTMKDILSKHKDIVYLSAHEKTLEHHISKETMDNMIQRDSDKI